MTGPSPCPSGPAGPTCPPQRDLHGPGVVERVERLKQDLLAKVLVLGRELPVNTLDELIDQLGGPERVAEVSPAAAPPGLGLWRPLVATPSPCQSREVGGQRQQAVLGRRARRAHALACPGPVGSGRGLGVGLEPPAPPPVFPAHHTSFLGCSSGATSHTPQVAG